MKITREELQAIENHISNIPHVGGMYAPVLIAWCRALLDEQDAAYRRGAEATLDACVATIHDGGLVWTRESAERALREIGILEEP